MWLLEVVLLSLIVIAAGVTTSAKDTSLEKQLNQAYVGKVLALRTASTSDKLLFNSSGQLLGKSSDGPWTTAGALQVTKLSLKPDLLEIQGNRVLFAWREGENSSPVPVLMNRVLIIAVSLDSHPSDRIR